MQELAASSWTRPKGGPPGSRIESLGTHPPTAPPLSCTSAMLCPSWGPCLHLQPRVHHLPPEAPEPRAVTPPLWASPNPSHHFLGSPFPKRSFITPLDALTVPAGTLTTTLLCVSCGCWCQRTTDRAETAALSSRRQKPESRRPWGRAPSKGSRGGQVVATSIQPPPVSTWSSSGHPPSA